MSSFHLSMPPSRRPPEREVRPWLFYLAAVIGIVAACWVAYSSG